MVQSQTLTNGIIFFNGEIAAQLTGALTFNIPEQTYQDTIMVNGSGNLSGGLLTVNFNFTYQDNSTDQCTFVGTKN